MLAVSPKCAVRDGVELLVLAVPEDGWLKPVLILVWFAAAGDPVANVASKGRAKDAKYRHGHKYPQDRLKPGTAPGAVKCARFEGDERDGNPNTCAENTEYDNTSNHLNDLHNPMRRQCQFTVKRPEKRVDLTVAGFPTRMMIKE